jgi:hypothetical protein
MTMTDSNRSLSELPGLLAERRRYESWLAALDARRETTPGHVFERVQADYRSRLARVTEQLESHRHIVEEERTSVQSRLSLLQAEERMRRDERAELELRSHVGELVGEEAGTAFKTVDDAIERLLGEKSVLQARVDELATLLDDQPQAGRWSPELSSAPVSSPAVESKPPATDRPVAERQGSERPSTERLSGERRAPEPPAPARPNTPPAPASKPAPTASDPSFDELAFLNTVVGAGDASQTLVAQSRRDASLVRDERAAESLLSGVADAKAGAPSSEAPLAANVTANVPITLRATANEQTKTLKCNECGGMNYPTEWYCERCGAELAAL